MDGGCNLTCCLQSYLKISNNARDGEDEIISALTDWCVYLFEVRLLHALTDIDNFPLFTNSVVGYITRPTMG